VADYSPEASARAVLAALDALGVERAHVLGAGHGGAVAIEMTRAAPGRVRSLALVSSVGAQEFELLGNHLVNKIVYGFHFVFIRAAEDVIPHFGLLDRLSVNTAYARLFWDGDFTGIKNALREYAGAVFIAHGEDDLLVPADAARYSARLARDAETYFAPGGHHVFERERAGELAERLGKFIHSVETGTRAAVSAPAEDPGAPPPAAGSRLWVLMLIIIVCAFVAEDPTCLAAGLLVAQGVLSFTAAAIACLVSILIGDFTLYLVGYALGRPALRKAPLKWIIAEYEIDRMAGWFEKRGFQGLMLIVTSRFIPASRLPTFVCAGVMRLSMKRLWILFFVAAAVWTPLIVWFGEAVGGNVVEEFERVKSMAMWIILGLLFAVWFLMHVLVPAVTWRGRRMLVMKTRRWARHEYWPVWLLHGPVAFYRAFCGLKRFCGGILTAANPGLGWLGGCTGEAKSETLGRFAAASKVAPVAAWAPVPAGGKGGAPLEARVESVRRFMAENKLAYPIALKPDIGDNGIGINKISNDAQLAEWLGQYADAALAQRWVDGEEYEVLWCRKPGERHGRVLSVVEKRPPSVTGDGRRTLEELIWADDRTVSRGTLYLRLNWRRASEVIPAGEVVRLSSVGTWACGVQSVDRQELRTEALAAALDRAADASDGGLHCVVYDLRVPDAASLRVGAGWTVTGISGADTVSSRLRDQYVRLGYALASARRQIRVACEAADAARARGVRAASFWGMLASRAEARGRRMIDLRN
jgi:membrane protein DedA with SNARE-associated domain